MNPITELNDRFRRGDAFGGSRSDHHTLGQYIMTSGVQALSPELQLQLIRLVQQFDSFTTDNDPYAEHDFGKVTLDGKDYFFKIDYYDPTLTRHSNDPASPNATRRVMTLMRTEEY
jgi:hypothetical protein